MRDFICRQFPYVRVFARSQQARGIFWLMFVVALITGCQRSGGSGDLDAVGLTGVQQIGPNFSISEFYVDNYGGGNVGRGGGGGSNTCCVMIPRTWRPGLVIDLRWSVADWSKENVEEIDKGVYKSIAFKDFRARVPVEKYDSPHRLYIHFFPDGKARAIACGPCSVRMQRDSQAVALATKGEPVEKLFSEQEIQEFERKHRESVKKFGDWR